MFDLLKIEESEELVEVWQKLVLLCIYLFIDGLDLE